MGKYIVGIDLGGTSAKMAIASPDGQLKYKWTIGTEIHQEGQLIVPAIIQSIKRSLAEHDLTDQDIIGIGMGTPGAVDVKAKTVIGAYNLNWKTTQDLGQQFGQAFDIPFFVDNDANVAALGEQWLGAGNGAENVVMVTLGTGIGGGVVINGQLYRGSGAAGEIGHMTIEDHTDIHCTCGKKGCFEALASANGIVRLAKEMVDQDEGNIDHSEFYEKVVQDQTFTSLDIFEAAKASDGFASQVVDKVAYYIGLGVSHIANILNPSAIVLGGGMAGAGEFLREKVDAYYRKFTYQQIRETTQIVLAQLGNDAGVIGAVNLINTEIK